MDATNEAFPDACASGFEHLISIMPEMRDDAHVVAAALLAEANAMVTHDLKGFPPHLAPSYKTTVKTAQRVPGGGGLIPAFWPA